MVSQYEVRELLIKKKKFLTTKQIGQEFGSTQNKVSAKIRQLKDYFPNDIKEKVINNYKHKAYKWVGK
jgi:hypothetical protein